MSSAASGSCDGGLDAIASEFFIADRWAQLKLQKDKILEFILGDCIPVLSALKPERRDLLCLEVLGSSAIAEECSLFGPSMPFNDVYGHEQNILSEEGFGYLLTLALRVQQGGT
eukprot:1382707-Pyramimonas_sp.AAC.1